MLNVVTNTRVPMQAVNLHVYEQVSTLVALSDERSELL